MIELLTVEDLSVRYRTPHGAALVLDGVSIAVQPGEIVGLVGESGSGKTTLGRAILGSLPETASITDGALRFRGEDLRGLTRRDIRRRIAGRAVSVVPQDPFGSFNPLFTVGTQIRDLMRWKGTGDRRARDAAIMEMLAAVQLPDPAAVLRKLPHQLSGGQRQRLMIAMALLLRPALVIADEPTTALDVTIQAQILRLLHRLARQHGVSVLYTTHDLGTAYEICDRIVVLYAGQAMEAAPTATFFAAPAHPYTVQLLANLPRRGLLPEGIAGDMPSLVAPPPGCRFHPRCARSTAICREVLPPAVALAVEHSVRCHHPVAS